MFKRSLINLSKLSENNIIELISTFDTILTDCDGVLWLQNNLIKGSSNVINKLSLMGKNVFLVTNNSTVLRDDILSKAKELGFNCVKKNEIITTAFIAANYLKAQNFNKTVYIIGSSGIGGELDLVGIKHTGIGEDYIKTDLLDALNTLEIREDIGAVIVGFDAHFSYPKMIKAATYANKSSCLFIATNTDERHPNNMNIVIPGAGGLVKAVEICTEREAYILGKPNTWIGDYIIKKYGIDPKTTLMIGDRCNTDILFGNRCGFVTLLVLSGVTTLEDVESKKNSCDALDLEMVPDFYLRKLGDLEPYIDKLL